MVAFFDDLTAACIDALTDPTRLLTFRHLANAAAQSFPKLPGATRILFDGFIYEMISTSRLGRMQTLSRLGKPYHVLFAPSAEPALTRSLAALETLVLKRGAISAEEAGGGLGLVRGHDIETLFGNLVYRGRATIDVFDGSPLLVIRAPNAA